MWKKTVSRQAAGQMFGGQMFRGEGVALVCLRNPHGWNIEGQGNHVRYEVEEERGCLCQLLGLELMPSANGIHQGLWERWLDLLMLLEIRCGYCAQ